MFAFIYIFIYLCLIKLRGGIVMDNDQRSIIHVIAFIPSIINEKDGYIIAIIYIIH